MKEFFCKACNNTGSTSMAGMLDCIAPGCEAAATRAAFDKWLLCEGYGYSGIKEWAIYRYAVRTEVESAAMLLDENERLRNTIAGMQSRMGAKIMAEARDSAMGQDVAPVVTVDTPELDKTYYACDLSPETVVVILHDAKAHTAQAVAAARLLADNAEGMAECMRMFRDGMIHAGVIDESVPPMFMSEAILGAIGAKQAEIDRLMLEHCPGEMTADQMATWEASQRCAPAAAPQQHAQAADVDALSNLIRTIDGNHSMGAGALAEKISEWFDSRANGNAAPFPLTEEQVVGVLHSCGIDTYPSVNGFTSLQVSATSVTWICEVVRRCIALIASAEPATAPAQVAVPEGELPPLPDHLDIAEHIALSSVDSVEFSELMGAYAQKPNTDTAWAVLHYADKRMHAIMARRFALAAAPAAPQPAQAQPVSHNKHCGCPNCCEAQPVAFVPGGVQALADVTGQPVMYGAQEVKPAVLSRQAVLPEPDVIAYTAIGDNDAYSPTALRQYGNACRQQGRATGIEEAAKVAERCYVKDTFKFELGTEAAAAIRALAAKPAEATAKPMTMSYVQNVPDQCDRITWRGAYYHLSKGQQPAQAKEDADLAAELYRWLSRAKFEDPKDEVRAAEFGNRLKVYALAAQAQPVADAAPIRFNWTRDGMEQVADGIYCYIAAQPYPAQGDALSQDAVDAARYRYLCNNAYRETFDLSESQESIDAAIDAARALAAKPAEGGAL